MFAMGDFVDVGGGACLGMLVVEVDSGGGVAVTTNSRQSEGAAWCHSGGGSAPMVAVWYDLGGLWSDDGNGGTWNKKSDLFLCLYLFFYL